MAASSRSGDLPSMAVLMLLLFFFEARSGAQETLSQIAAKAKHRGESSVVLQSYPSLDGSSLDVMTAAREFQTFEGTVVDSYKQVTDRAIGTWYRVKMTNVLTAGIPCGMCDPNMKIPAGAFPGLGRSEVAIPVAGGTAVVDGVKVSYASTGYAKLNMGEKYLFFVARLPGNPIAFLPEGPYGILKIEPNGRVRAIVNEPGSLAGRVAALGTMTPVRRKLKKR